VSDNWLRSEARSHSGRAAVSRDQTRARQHAAAEPADKRRVGRFHGRQEFDAATTTFLESRFRGRRGKLRNCLRMRPFASVRESRSTTITYTNGSKRVSTTRADEQ